MSTAEKASADLGEVVSLCSLRAGSGLFGIDTRQICEVLGALTLQPVPLAPAHIAGVVLYRGEVLTTVSLRALLGLDDRRNRGSEANCVLVLDDGDDGRFGLEVDGVGGMGMMAESAFEANRNPLGARSAVLFDGVCKVQSAVMMRLNPQRLRPSQPMPSGLPGTSKPEESESR